MPDQVGKGSRDAAAKRPKVAVMDEDPAVCSAVKFSLELEGFAVRTYCKAAEILHASEIGSFDCFVIDQHMPEMSGMELIQALRRRQVATPAILIVSRVNAAVSARAAKAAIPIVEKPLLGNALVERIREACELS
jgi:FixJ family two-component response regulator